MSWKLVSLGSLLAVLALSGCSTPSSDQESATTPTAHTRCDAQAAAFAVGKKRRRSSWSKPASKPVRRPLVSSGPTMS